MKVKIFDWTLLGIYMTVFIMSIFYPDYGKYLLISTLALCFRLMFLHKKNQALLIVLIFVSTYFLYMIFYYFFGIHYSTYINLQTLENTNGTLRVVGLFIIVLFYKVIKKDEWDYPLRDYLEFANNKFVFIGCILVMGFILIYALKGNNILQHKYGESTTNSSLFEYYFMFAVIAKCNSNSKIADIVLFLINILYAVATLLLGLRLVTLIVIMYVFIFYFENKFKTKWVVMAAVFGFIGMSAMSAIRAGLGSMDLFTLFGINGDYMMNNQGDVFLTSSVHYGMVHNGFMDITARFLSLLGFIANIFLPSSKQFSIGILNKYIEGTYSVGGGGFGAMYAYVWLGYIGVILLALFIAHFINNIFYESKKSYYGIFLVITSFRWFAYSLPIIFKMGLYLFLFYTVVSIAKKMNDIRILDPLFEMKDKRE